MGKLSAKNLVLFTLFATNLVDQPAPEVEIDQGKLTGKISSDGTFYEYLGIPYGTATSRNRFQAPLPPPSWRGTYRAIDEHHTCMQASLLGGTSGTEDCLKMNVYIPVTEKKHLPVMVWIHGGAFILGSGGKLVYSPEFLVKHEVILVTFNYRLGPLGFICLGIEEAPGNAGLKDQVAALRWVKKNIAYFGGDPENITIFGQSAGGTSVSAMMLTNATHGLFQRAIVQSGSIIATWGINPQPLMTAGLLAKAIGYQGPEDPIKLYEFLSKAPLEDLFTAKTKKPFTKFFDTELTSLPCIENPFPGVEPIFTDRAFNVLKAYYEKNISVIFGSTDKEGLFLINESQRKSIDDRNKGYLFASDLEFPSEEEAERVAKKVKEFYFGAERISIDRLDNLTNLYSHLYFDIPGLLETDVLVRNPDISVYNYQFRFNGNRNIMKYITGNGNVTGACHADELFYLFNSKYWPVRVKKEDQVMIDWITSLWTNFAKYGDPTPKFSTSFPVHWEASRIGDKKILYIDKDPRMGPVPNMQAYDLWRDIYSKYRRKSWTR